MSKLDISEHLKSLPNRVAKSFLNDKRLWLARILIALVILWNLQAALMFIISPETFAPGFQLAGVPGDAAVRGVGILFLMWNVPYAVAFWNPRKYKLSLSEALVMQSLGVVGESFIFFNLPVEFGILRGSILRFILFDAAGLLALASAFWLVKE
jgi:hypothetical protein